MILFCGAPSHGDAGGGDLDLAGLAYGDGWRKGGSLRARVDQIAHEEVGARSRDRTPPAPVEPVMDPPPPDPFTAEQHAEMRPRLNATMNPRVLHHRLVVRCDCGSALTARLVTWERFCVDVGQPRMTLELAKTLYEAFCMT